jgi:hypothetical protein
MAPLDGRLSLLNVVSVGHSMVLGSPVVHTELAVQSFISRAVYLAIAARSSRTRMVLRSLNAHPLDLRSPAGRF